jgi:predicted MPP superfamily phosphohydrolase
MYHIPGIKSRINRLTSIMALFESSPPKPLSRRRFLKGSMASAAALALYSGEIERHWIDVTHSEVALAGLPTAFDGYRIAQLSDIHMDEFTEPFFLRQVIDRVNQLQPDAVVLTGDFVSDGPGTNKFSLGAAWQCANLLNELSCKNRFAALGNHDHAVGVMEVIAALRDNGIQWLINSSLPIERGTDRIWLAGVDDPVLGRPDVARAVPSSISGITDEPIILLCHAPDYVDHILTQPAGKAIALVLSGHTHGGQVRLPLLGALELPDLGRKYVEGWFRFGAMQLYVNRGIGTVGLPFRLDCPPEITLFTLRSGPRPSNRVSK